MHIFWSNSPPLFFLLPSFKIFIRLHYFIFIHVYGVLWPYSPPFTLPPPFLHPQAVPPFYIHHSFSLPVLEFELRVSHLLGRSSTTWATASLNYFWDWGSCVLCCLYLCFLCSWDDRYKPPSPAIGWNGVSLCAQAILPISISWVAGVIYVRHIPGLIHFLRFIFCMRERTCDMCLSQSGLFCLRWWSSVPYISLKMTQFFFWRYRGLNLGSRIC
jgi:hypothetical protein